MRSTEWVNMIKNIYVQEIMNIDGEMNGKEGSTINDNIITDDNVIVEDITKYR